MRDATFANVVSEARRALARLVPPPEGEECVGRTLSEALPLHPRRGVEVVDLRGGHVLARNENVLVVRHPKMAPFGCLRPGAGVSRKKPHQRIGPSRHLAALMRRFFGQGKGTGAGRGAPAYWRARPGL